MSPTRFRCANSLDTLVAQRKGPHDALENAGRQERPQQKQWRIRVSIPVLNLAKVVCYHVQQSPRSASFGTRTRAYSLEGSNSTPKLRMHTPRCALSRGPNDAKTKHLLAARRALPVGWPSGLRRSTQVRVSSEAWVRTPLQPHSKFLPLSRFLWPGRFSLPQDGDSHCVCASVPPSSVGRAQDF